MWLPKDERRLLQAYYLVVGCDLRSSHLNKQKLGLTIETCRIATRVEEIKVAPSRTRPAPDDDKLDRNNPVGDMKRWLERKSKVETANSLLSQRELINLLDDQTNSVQIGLTIQGYDLGRKYANWFTRTGLWFAEYKHHWIWLIVSFLGGVIGGLLINWLSKVIE